jgi:hypothetical protein
MAYMNFWKHTFHDAAAAAADGNLLYVSGRDSLTIRIAGTAANTARTVEFYSVDEAGNKYFDKFAEQAGIKDEFLKYKRKLGGNNIAAMLAMTIDAQIYGKLNIPTKTKILGMNADMMTMYIKFVADRLLVILGYSKFFNVTNPFDFMESISIEGKTNFFEHRPTQYQKASVLNKSRDSSFKLIEDF